VRQEQGGVWGEVFGEGFDVVYAESSSAVEDFGAEFPVPEGRPFCLICRAGDDSIYTKGKILKKEGVDVFYVLISSKKSTDI